MPMSPRLLRPRVTGFNPKSIAGLALWLDASDSSTLFQDATATTPATATSDPVGAWLDKSGNARHATQSTAGLRGLVLASAGRTRVDIPSTANAGFVIANSPTTSSTATIIQVARFAGNPHFLTLMRGDTNAFFDAAESGSAASPASVAGSPSYFVQGAGITATRGSLYAALNNTTAVFSATNVNTSTWSSGWRGYSYGTSYQFTGEVAEVLVYSRSISSLERQRIERYLAAKWGITLAPQVSNADAQDWINRVYANGGTVSASTAAAVNTFCDAIDAASIRDRFYRLNLFCGTGLNACLVPLYRGQGLGGTQYGNTTDTNVGPFVSGDYNEASGLKGNGSSKYLATGLPMTFASTEQLHLYASFLPDQASFSVLLGARTNLAGSLAMEANYNAASANRPRTSWFGGGAQPANNCDPLTGRTQYLVNYDGSQPLLVLGRNVSLNNGNNAGSYSATYSTPFFVFAGEQTGTGMAGHTTHTIDSYSIGVAFTSSTQRTAFHNAMATFRAALGRT